MSLVDYERVALRLAHNPPELAALRMKLAANRDTTPLFDSERYTRGLEAEYERMWQAHVSAGGPSMRACRVSA